MTTIAKATISDIAVAVVGLLPAGSLIQGAAKAAAGVAFDALTKDDRDAVERVTTIIFDALTDNARELSPADPGRARSAAYNVVETIQNSRLDADRIIECCLDADRLHAYLLQFPAAGIDAASEGRKHLYNTYLKIFAEKVIEAVFATPPFQRRLFRRILTNQREIIETLNNTGTRGQ